MNVLPIRFLMLIFAGWINRHQQDVIEFLEEEEANTRVTAQRAKTPPIEICCETDDLSRRRCTVDPPTCGHSPMRMRRLSRLQWLSAEFP